MGLARTRTIYLLINKLHLNVLLGIVRRRRAEGNKNKLEGEQGIWEEGGSSWEEGGANREGIIIPKGATNSGFSSLGVGSKKKNLYPPYTMSIVD